MENNRVRFNQQTQFDIHLQWFGGKVTTPVQANGSRIANSSRTWQAAEDTSVTDWDKSNEIIFSAGLYQEEDRALQSPRFRWRNKTQSGSFAELGSATGTDECRSGTDTVLVDGNAVESSESGLSGTGLGDWIDGEEKENKTSAWIVSTPLQGEWTEDHIAINFEYANDGDEYEFEIWDSQSEESTGVYLATITMAEGASTAEISDSVGITDSVTTKRNIKKTLTDSVGITDTLGTARQIFKSIADAVGITDVLVSALKFLVTLSDSVGITDVLSKIANRKRTLTDTVAVLGERIEFGYPTYGTTDDSGAYYASCCHFTTGPRGGVTKRIYAWVDNRDSVPHNIKLAIYDHDAVNNWPQNQLATEVTIEVPGNQSGGIVVSAPYEVTLSPNTKYWLTIIYDNGYIDGKWTDDEVNKAGWYYVGSFDLQDPWPDSGNRTAKIWSIWCDYYTTKIKTARKIFKSILDSVGITDLISKYKVSYFGRLVEDSNEYSMTGYTNFNDPTYIDYVCPGTGLQQIVELAARAVDSLGTGHLRVAIYSLDRTLIAQGETELLVSTANWYKHTSFVDENEDPITAPLLVGGTSYILAVTFDGSSANHGFYNSVTNGYADYITQDYTSGFPAIIGTGTDGILQLDVRCGVVSTGGTAFQKLIQDSVGITDILSTARNIVRTIADAVGITDIISAVKGAAEVFVTITDNVGITDVISTARNIAKTIADSVGITDVISTARNIVKTITDTVGSTDVIGTARNIVKSISDTVDITDIVGTARNIVKSISDTVGITDVISRVIKITVSIADSVGITDILTKKQSLARVITDTVGITDTLSRIGTFLRTITDQVGITDTLNTARNIVKLIADSVGITDIISAIKIGGMKYASITDSVGITDVVSTTRALARIISDIVGITDVVTRIGTFFRTINNTVNVTDILSTARNIRKSISDAVGITDLISTAKKIPVIISDFVSITSTIGTNIIYGVFKYIIEVTSNFYRTIERTSIFHRIVERISDLFTKTEGDSDL